MGSGRMCTPPTIMTTDTPTTSTTAMDGDTDPVNDARFHQATLDQLSIIKTAFQCDLTRVASFSFGWGNSGIRFSQVIPKVLPNLMVDDVEGYHAISHENGGATKANPHVSQFAIDKYFCYMTANLLQDLANTPDGMTGGSLLDNTLVVFWNECSIGNTHDTQNMPVLLFGGKFLKLNGGHFFDFSDKAAGKGRYMSDFWVQLSKAWAMADGVAGSGYEPLVKYGDDAWNLGDMSELFG
jgi:hypothetical protein